MGKGWYFPLMRKYIPRITKWLNKLPKVNWDRVSQKRGHLYIFGWIDRKDSYKDFFMIDFVRGRPVDFCSSDTKYNLEYSRILGVYHQKCWRVEHKFKEVKNAIKSKKDAKQENT